MRKLVLIFAAILMTACTYNISMAHTSGTATDTIDDAATNTPNVVPTVTLIPKPGV
jgi:hypothetical protein